MKKVLFSAILTVVIAASSFAANVTNATTNAARVFAIEFKGAENVSWTSSADYVKASFTLDKKKMEAFYDLQGSLIATSSNISLDDVPTSAKRSLAKKFAGYTVKEAIKFDGTDETAYYISAENDTQSLILKVSDTGFVSVFKQTKK